MGCKVGPVHLVEEERVCISVLERTVRRARSNESLGPFGGPRRSMQMLMKSGVRISTAKRGSRRRT